MHRKDLRRQPGPARFKVGSANNIAGIAPRITRSDFSVQPALLLTPQFGMRSATSPDLVAFPLASVNWLDSAILGYGEDMVTY